jgi:S1-C subfamily serine protease
MLILGLLLGGALGGTAGFFAGQNAGGFARASIRQFTPQPNQGNPFPSGPRGFAPGTNNAVTGAHVDSITDGSPAAKAGLQVGDTITAIGGTKIDSTNSLSSLIQAKKPGDSVDLAVTRGSQNITITVQLGPNPQNSGSAYLGISYTPAYSGGGGRFRFPTS